MYTPSVDDEGEKYEATEAGVVKLDVEPDVMDRKSLNFGHQSHRRQ